MTLCLSAIDSGLGVKTCFSESSFAKYEKTISSAVEELSKVCATTGVVLSAHTSLCITPILENGTEAQKLKKEGKYE